MVAFTEPEQKIGATIEFTDPGSELTWIFEVPAGVGLRGLKNALLAIEHPNYDLEVDEERKRVIVSSGKNTIVTVENFPANDGWYETDLVTMIPINKPSCKNHDNSRHLERIPQKVTLITRGIYSEYDIGGLGDSFAPSFSLNTLIEKKKIKKGEINFGN